MAEQAGERRGPSPKWQQNLEGIDALLKARQKMIAEMLGAIIAWPQE